MEARGIREAVRDQNNRGRKIKQWFLEKLKYGRRRTDRRGSESSRSVWIFL
jgi:hypothetical protein